MAKPDRYLIIRNKLASGRMYGMEKMLFEWLAGVDHSKQNVVLAVPDPALELFKEQLRILGQNHVKLIGFGQSGAADFKTVFSLCRAVRPAKVLFMEGNIFDFKWPEVATAGLMTRGRVFLSEHLAPPMEKGNLPKEQTKSFWLKAQFCRGILAVGEDVRRGLIEKHACPANKIRTGYHGVDLTRFGYSGGQKNSFDIISFARLSPEKRPERILNVFANVAEKFPQSRLFLCGEGKLRKKLEEDVEQLSIRDRVRFLGYREDVAELLRPAGIFVSFSSIEGLSISLLEAMACGLICLSTQTPGTAEVIRDGENGFLVPETMLEEKLVQIMKMPEEGKEIIRRNAAATIAEGFDLYKNLDKQLRIIGLK